MESRGIFLMAFKHPAYGFMAYQLAMSLKHYSPHIPIYLLTDQIAVSRVRTMQFFDTVEYMETPVDPALCKINMYDKLPFDHNIFLDVDGLCMSEMDSLFAEFEKGEKEFRCFVYEYYNQDSPNDMPLMVWARKDTIWDHYQLNGEILPATQSSLLYIRKGKFCADLYSKMQDNYQNRIPLEVLKHKWGGGQPDELYLNVTLAQLGYDPQTSNSIWFADNTSLKPHQLKHQYKILSLFGTANNVKLQFERFYDKEVRTMAALAGVAVTYKWKAIKSSKHANVRTVKTKRQAFKGGFIRSEKIDTQPPITKKGKTLLFTSYFDSKNSARNREFITCLNNNIANSEIDHIYVSAEDELQLKHEKLTVVNSQRPTYQALFDWANKVSGKEDIIVIANSDIYFDHTIQWPHRIHMTRTMIALSRWDVQVHGNTRLFTYEHSQDTWIFKGRIDLKEIDYYFGLPGCDNRLAHDAAGQGYRVANPAKDIITHHLHTSGIRHYTQNDRLPGSVTPVYITSIRDLKTNLLLIKQPGKVGDILICLPIARYYTDQGYEVHWDCPVQYHSLFAYVDYARAVTGVNDKDYIKIIDLSFGINIKSQVHHWWLRHKGEFPSFVQAKYHLAAVPIQQRYNLKYNRNANLEDSLFDHLGCNMGGDYIIVHRSSDYGDPIEVVSDKRIIYFEPIGSYTVFDWRKVIEGASEIHCIDSALANFVEVIPCLGRKFFYRVAARTTESWFDFSKWEVILPEQTVTA